MGRSSLPYAQVATDLFADPKVRRLFRDADESIAYAAMGIFLDVLTSAWSKGSRDPTARERTELDVPVAALIRVGLLDGDGRIPEESWEKWWGPVRETRSRKSDAQARWRAKSRERESETAVDDRRYLQQSPSSPLFSSISTVESSTDEDVSPARARSREGPGPVRWQVPGDVLDVYERLTTRVPAPGAMDWLDRLVSQYGDDRVGRQLADEWSADPTIRNFLGRVQRSLHRDETEATKREEEDERKRASRTDADRATERLESIRRASELPAEVGRAGLAKVREALEGRKTVDA